MGFAAKVLCDSVSPTGIRLTTLEVTLPRIVLAEFNTHRVFSRNSASSRAIPVEKRIAAVEADPFIPEEFGRNQKGMQAKDLLDIPAAVLSREVWKDACKEAVRAARGLATLGVHKQLANRLLEPFLWHTIVVTATEWENFTALRCHPNAQPEIRKAAEMMRAAREKSAPRPVDFGEWHLPYVLPEDLEEPTLVELDFARISCARCARVSYLTHDGRRDLSADLDLAGKLQEAGHMSPFEHAARAMPTDRMIGNFRGWEQYRKLLPNEHNFALTGGQEALDLVVYLRQAIEERAGHAEIERLRVERDTLFDAASKLALAVKYQTPHVSRALAALESILDPEGSEDRPCTEPVVLAGRPGLTEEQARRGWFLAAAWARLAQARASLMQLFDEDDEKTKAAREWLESIGVDVTADPPVVIPEALRAFRGEVDPSPARAEDLGRFHVPIVQAPPAGSWQPPRCDKGHITRPGAPCPICRRASLEAALHDPETAEGAAAILEDMPLDQRPTPAGLAATMYAAQQRPSEPPASAFGEWPDPEADERDPISLGERLPAAREPIAP